MSETEKKQKNAQQIIKKLFAIAIVFLLLIGMVSTQAVCASDSFDPATVFWEQLPLRNQWQMGQDLVGGEGMQMVFDIDWNPADPNILYLITDTTRVWKSIDRGESWFPVGQDLPVQGGVSIVSDPNNSEIIFLAGAKMATKDSKHPTSIYDGIYRSTDGGHTWSGLLEALSRPV